MLASVDQTRKKKKKEKLVDRPAETTIHGHAEPIHGPPSLQLPRRDPASRCRIEPPAAASRGGGEGRATHRRDPVSLCRAPSLLARSGPSWSPSRRGLLEACSSLLSPSRFRIWPVAACSKPPAAAPLRSEGGPLLGWGSDAPPGPRPPASAGAEREERDGAEKDARRR